MTFLYYFTIAMTFAFCVAVPSMLISTLAEWRRRKRAAILLIVTGMIIAGYLAGGWIGWSFRPDAWRMSLRETAYASVHADIYGHPVEHDAERALFYFLFPAAVGFVFSGAAGIGMAHKWNSRMSSSSTT